MSAPCAAAFEAAIVCLVLLGGIMFAGYDRYQNVYGQR